jgi:hypothetical protein
LYMLKKFGHMKWSLCVDIDEFFEFPYSDRIGFSSFLDYLNLNSYNAVVAQMLDMFSEHSIDKKEVNIGKSFRQCFEYYDISDVIKVDYKYHFGISNLVSNDNIYCLIGGVRKRAFGLNRILLTKHPLIYMDKKIKPLCKKKRWNFVQRSVHSTANARLADITCALFHYKINDRLLEAAKKHVREKNYFKQSFEYQKYLNVLQKDNSISLKNATSTKIQSVNDLIEEDFLVVTRRYSDFSNQCMNRSVD